MCVFALSTASEALSTLTDYRRTPERRFKITPNNRIKVACILLGDFPQIVDDDEAVRDVTKTLVRSQGYHASTFGSADKFLNSEQISDTSCPITDVQMPGLSGCDLQDRLIARGHRIPIIFITGYPDENVRARAIKAGAVALAAAR